MRPNWCGSSEADLLLVVRIVLRPKMAKCHRCGQCVQSGTLRAEDGQSLPKDLCDIYGIVMNSPGGCEDDELS